MDPANAHIANNHLKSTLKLTSLTETSLNGRVQKSVVWSRLISRFVFFSSPGNHPSLVVVKVHGFHFACFWRNAEQVILMEEMHHITACCLPFTLAAHYLMLTKY